MTNERTSLFLMANLGAETTRLVSACKQGDNDNVHTSLTRAEHILDELLALPEMKSRKGELDILRDSLNQLTTSDPENFPVNPIYLKSYFTPFALRLMKR